MKTVTSLQYYRYDGVEAKRVTKAEIQTWVRRVREDLRAVEDALRGNDLESFKEFADDAAGAAAELQNYAEATIAEQEV